MIHFFRLKKEEIEPLEFSILKGKNVPLFIIKKFLLFLFFIYATEFVAMTFPFFNKPFIAAYFAGSCVTSIYFIRLINKYVQLYRYNKGIIRIDQQGITVTGKSGKRLIPVEQITYLEYNVLGNLLIKEKEKVTSFPVDLLAKEEKTALFKQLDDLAPKRSHLLRKMWELFDAIGVALIFAVHIIQFVIQAYFIPSPSMMDTLVEGDHLFVEKITFGPTIPKLFCMKKEIRLDFLGLRKVQRGDIVIFLPPHETNKDYIKRCIALPGDDIRFKDGFVYLNGKKQIEPYVGKNITVAKEKDVEGIVPEGKVVVLGDNRQNSHDSRGWGYLDIDRIKGKAFVLYWNTDNIKNLDFSRIGFIH